MIRREKLSSSLLRQIPVAASRLKRLLVRMGPLSKVHPDELLIVVSEEAVVVSEEAVVVSEEAVVASEETAAAAALVVLEDLVMMSLEILQNSGFGSGSNEGKALNCLF